MGAQSLPFDYAQGRLWGTLDLCFAIILETWETCRTLHGRAA